VEEMRTETPFPEKEGAPLGENPVRNYGSETAKFLPGSKSKLFAQAKKKSSSLEA